MKCPHWDILKVIFMRTWLYTLCYDIKSKFQSLFGQGNVVTNLCVSVSFLFHSVTSLYILRGKVECHPQGHFLYNIACWLQVVAIVCDNTNTLKEV